MNPSKKTVKPQEKGYIPRALALDIFGCNVLTRPPKTSGNFVISSI